MVCSELFLAGNLVADAAIGMFAFVVWWHENQSDRLRRVVALALTSGFLASNQAVLIESYVMIGDRQKLLELTQTKLEQAYIEKLTSLICSFSVMRKLRPLIVGMFATGILCEAIALAT